MSPDTKLIQQPSRMLSLIRISGCFIQPTAYKHYLRQTIASINTHTTDVDTFPFSIKIGYHSLVFLEIVQFTPQIGQCCFKNCCKLPSAQQHVTPQVATMHSHILENLFEIINLILYHEFRNLTFLCQLILRLFSHLFCMSRTVEEL
jgi:hypothetical protein